MRVKLTDAKGNECVPRRLIIGDVIAYSEKREIIVCLRPYPSLARLNIGKAAAIYLPGRLSSQHLFVPVMELISAITGLTFEEVTKDYPEYDLAFKIVAEE